MKIYKNLKIKNKHKKSVIAIGNFDGLHLGHKKVLDEAKRKAKRNNKSFGLVTFEPVPVMFFNSNIKNHRINTIEQKKNYLKKLKLDFLIIIKFDKTLSNIPAEKFIKDILYKKLNAKFIYVSQNFKFGKNRKGNVKTLKVYEKKFSYKTIVTSPYKESKKIISSSLIRKNISMGKISVVTKLLGRPWSIIGKVIKGSKRGRTVGYPTCNILLENYILPKLGVYAVLVKTKNFKKKGIANIGYRPTFNGKKLLLEVNIFGINLNLYNKIIEVSFLRFIRPEKKFNGVNQLKKQIKKDINKVKKYVQR